MKTITKLSVLSVIILTSFACQKKNGIEYIYLTREILKKKTILLSNPAEIPLNIDVATCNAGAFYLFKDTLILAQNSPSNTSLIDLYSLKNRDRIN